VNTNNSIEEEIKERIAAGNRAYHVHKKTVHILWCTLVSAIVLFFINSGMSPQVFFSSFFQRSIKFYENPFPWSQRWIDLEKYRRSFLQVSIANGPGVTKRPRNTKNSLLQTTGKPADADGRSAKLSIYWHCVYLRRTRG
jgi:hypothetical protein